tara:strand:- start:13367 stop:13555 length:189 start_codon:yes stop_codon:yes gene_type:complete
MKYDMEYKEVSRKTLLMYFLQLPFCGDIAEFLNGLKHINTIFSSKFLSQILNSLRVHNWFIK